MAGVIAPRRVLFVVIAVVVAFNALVLALPEALIPHQTALTDWANLAAAALAAGCASSRATRSAELPLSLVVGCAGGRNAAWTAGQVESIYLNATGTYSYPSARDHLFLLFPPLASVALLPFGGPRLRRVLDAVMGGLAAGLVIWAVALRAVVQSAGAGEPLAGVVSIAYPTFWTCSCWCSRCSRSCATRLSLGSWSSAGLTAFARRRHHPSSTTSLWASIVLTPVDLGWGPGLRRYLAVRAGPAGGPPGEPRTPRPVVAIA